MSSFLLCAAGLVIGLVVSPELVARLLTDDGQLGVINSARIDGLRAAFISTSMVGIWLTRSVTGHSGLCDNLEAVWKSLQADQGLFTRLVFLIASVTFGAYNLSYGATSGLTASGTEYLSVAKGIASGNGFSVPETARWMWFNFEGSQPSHAWTTFHPTAMAEPIIPYLLSLFIGPDGSKEFVIVVWLQVCAWLFSAVLWREIISQLTNAWVGLVAGLILLSWPTAFSLHLNYLSPAPFGALFVALLAYLGVRLSQRPNLLLCVLAGLTMGISSLTLATTMAILPVICLCPLLHKVKSMRSWIYFGTVGLIAVMVITPWTYRNYQLMDAVIPVRTGLGLISHQGNPVLAASYHANSQACSNTSGKNMWQSTGPRDTTTQMVAIERQLQIYEIGFNCIAERAPPDYETFNEHERDGFYGGLARQFMRENPLTFVELAFFKYLRFVEGWHWHHTLTAGLALIGLVLGYREKSLIILFLMIAAYAGPYALGSPWFYRYRYPVEGIFFAFAFFGLYTVWLGNVQILKPLIPKLRRI